MSVLLVIIAERVEDWVTKGEVIDRYFNPGDRFDEVHLLLLGPDDNPGPEGLQRLVGRARVGVHHLPMTRGLFLRSLGWRPPLLRSWARRGVAVAREVRADVVRCYSAHLNVLVAREIQRELGIPYAVSLHGNPDVDNRGKARTPAERLTQQALKAVEAAGLRPADLVLPVYLPIVPYLERLGVTDYLVAYNMLNDSSIVRKQDYALHSPVRIACVSRQTVGQKNPLEIIRAMALLPDAELTVVGRGDLHDELRAAAAASEAADRITFIPSLANDEVCALLAESDLFAVHSDNWEISKSVMEAMLSGLPVLINGRPGEPTPELDDSLCVTVENTAASYAEAVRALLDDDARREALSRAAADHAWANWSPKANEERYASAYDRLLEQSRRQRGLPPG